MRKPLFVGNWKMHKKTQEAKELVRELKELLGEKETQEVAVAPPFTALYPVYEELKGSNIKLAAQDCFWEEEGAFTGEISPLMLADLGCSFCIIGHSERRSIFNEKDEEVAKKAKALLRIGISPIVCIGETLQQREEKMAFTVVKNQLKGSLKGIEENEIKNVVIAYEPVWAIGTGKTATAEVAQEMHLFIREWLAKTYSEKIADAVRILYGGSVKPDNIQGLMKMEDIDGALVGGASLNAYTFFKIVEEGTKWQRL